MTTGGSSRNIFPKFGHGTALHDINIQTSSGFKFLLRFRDTRSFIKLNRRRATLRNCHIANFIFRYVLISIANCVSIKHAARSPQLNVDIFDALFRLSNKVTDERTCCCIETRWIDQKSRLSIDNCHYRLNFDPSSQKTKIYQHSQKKHPKISKVVKFGGEMV